MSVSLVLINPKSLRNLASAVRAAACFGAERVIYTGFRVERDSENFTRLPRELRMKAYDVEYYRNDRPLDGLDGIPVAVEVGEGYADLPHFIHPDNAIYVFGPEDGSIPRSILKCCHRFVKIPSYHCLNLAMAANIVLYDRMTKQEASQ